MRNALFALPLMLLAGPALAADAGSNVVVIAVSKVHAPAALPGLCQVNGSVSDVLDGKGFRKGQAISLPVPCGTNPQPLRPIEGAPLADPQVLLKSRQGIAHLSDSGKLIWGATPKSYGATGPVSGYRVLDGVMVPLKQAAL